MPKKKQSIKGKILRKKSFFSLRGGSSIAMFVVIGMVVLFAGFMVMGANNLSAPDDSDGTGSSDGGTIVVGGECCDTGSGDSCKPISTDAVIWKGKEYWLLKSKIKLNEGAQHLNVLGKLDVTPNPGEGQWFVENNSSSTYNSTKWNCTGSDGRFDQMGSSKETCFKIPDDQLLFKCVEQCNVQDWKISKDAIYNVYFRAQDMNSVPDGLQYLVSPGVPDQIKNCTMPTPKDGESSTNVTGTQKIITPVTTGKQNLQLQTFDVENEKKIRVIEIAPWISPWCKPAIYVYPKEKTYVNVKVVTEYPFLFTIPRYPENGWNVLAYPDGRLLYGDEIYDYLFYEVEVSDTKLRLPQEGYVIKKADLPTFLPQLVSRLGLNEKETRQFTEYWVGVLPEAPFYKIRIVPQTNLDELSTLQIVPPPDQIVRVALHFEAIEKYEDMAAPQLQSVKRNGFVVSEWGGIFKKGRYTFSCLM